MNKVHWPCLVAHLRFVNSIPTAKDLRYIHDQFARLGEMVHYTDYYSKAGFKHHAARSMAVYRYSEDKDKLELKRNLEDICGILLQQDFERLKRQDPDNEKDIEPEWTLGKLTSTELKTQKDIDVTCANVADPFFRVNDLRLVGFDTTKVKIDGNLCIPLTVKTQDLT